LQKSNEKPNINSKNMLSKNNIVNYQTTVSNDKTLAPPNTSDVKSFPHFPSNSQNHTYFNKTRRQNVPPDTISGNPSSSFILEFKQLINPLIQLLLTVINKLILKDDKLSS